MLLFQASSKLTPFESNFITISAAVSVTLRAR
jgi:hypothetical protein